MQDELAQVRELFLEALEQDGLEARLAFVAERCSQNAELRWQLEEMLNAHHQSGGFLDSKADGTEEAPHIAERVGAIIGPYKLREQIGVGGFGVVFVAEQEQPIRRKVALKIIKPGMDSREIIARFEAERQALALMDHVNVAKVLDAGTTESGRPYFVMELVRGAPITRFCNQHKLTTDQRLQLFVDVCRAVQHAHQKGIIHRDLKPSNVMVTMRDDKPNVKVIDFGVAKAISQRLTEKSVYTAYGQLVGTPMYMSPEQAQLNEFDVDTRSDVYSLGVLLYELLTGASPFDRERFKKAGLDELRRMIREDDPPLPSARLSTLAKDKLSTVTEERQVDARRLAQTLRGELDWIVMKALEKDRNRRYESAADFAADVERYLGDEPVHACPPSKIYRLKKFARRNKIALGTTAVISAAILLGAGIAIWQAMRAEIALAENKQRTEEALRQTAIANAVRDFLQKDLLSRFDPHEEPEPNLKLRVVLDRAANNIEGKFQDQPLVEAALRETIGVAYRELGQPTEAAIHLDRCLELRRRLLGPRHEETLSVTFDRAMVYHDDFDYAAAERMLARLLAIRRETLGEDHEKTLRAMIGLGDVRRHMDKHESAQQLLKTAHENLCRTAGEADLEALSAANNLALCYQDQRQYDLAEPVLARSLDVARKTYGDGHHKVLAFMLNLGSVYQDQERLAEAQQLLEQALEISRRELGDEHPRTLVAMVWLGGLYSQEGRVEDAEPLLLKAYETRRRLMGDQHPRTQEAMRRLAVNYRKLHKYDKAVPLLVKVLEVRRRELGNEHLDTLRTMQNLGVAYRESGKYAEAEPLLVELVENARRTLGQDNLDTLSAMENLAMLYVKQSRFDDAEPLLVESLETNRRLRGKNHPGLSSSLLRLAELYSQKREFEAANPLLLESLELLRVTKGEEHPETLIAMNNVALSYTRQGNLEAAEKMYVKVLETVRRAPGEDHATALLVMINLTSVYLDQDKPAAAELLGVKALELSRRLHGDEHRMTMHALNRLARAYERQEKLDLAEPLFEEDLEISRRHFGEDHANTLVAMGNMAEFYRQRGKLTEAEPLFIKALAGLRSVLGDNNGNTMSCSNNLALLYANRGKYEEAVPLYEKTIESLQRTLGPDHPSTLSVMDNLAGALDHLDRRAEADSLRKTVHDIHLKVRGEDHPQTLRAALSLAEAALDQDNVEEATPWVAAVLQTFKRKPNGRTASEMIRLATCLVQMDRFDEAEPLARECVAIREKQIPDSWLLFNAKSVFGAALSGQSKYTEAEKMLIDGYEGMKAREEMIAVSSRHRLTQAVQRLVDLYDAWEKPEQSARWAKELERLDE